MAGCDAPIQGAAGAVHIDDGIGGGNDLLSAVIEQIGNRR